MKYSEFSFCQNIKQFFHIPANHFTDFTIVEELWESVYEFWRRYECMKVTDPYRGLLLLASQ